MSPAVMRELTSIINLSENLSESREERTALAKEMMRGASAILKGLGDDYSRVGWIVEDALQLLENDEFESDVDFEADYDVLVREFSPALTAVKNFQESTTHDDSDSVGKPQPSKR